MQARINQEGTTDAPRVGAHRLHPPTQFAGDETGEAGFIRDLAQPHDAALQRRGILRQFRGFGIPGATVQLLHQDWDEHRGQNRQDGQHTDHFDQCPAGPNRQGPPAEHKIDTVRQVIAELDFGDRLGIFDFAGSQYFSWVRAYRLTVRGEKGEIVDREVRYLKDFRTPVELTLRRSDTGQYNNHEGYFHRGIQAGEA